MRLGTLIEALEAVPANMPVVYSDGTRPGGFTSWRGVYAQLTLTPDSVDVTSGELLKKARKAVGATFFGYKGGDFVMDEDTPIWADDYGDCTYWAITDATSDTKTLTLHRVNVSDYRDW